MQPKMGLPEPLVMCPPVHFRTILVELMPLLQDTTPIITVYIQQAQTYQQYIQLTWVGSGSFDLPIGYGHIGVLRAEEEHGHWHTPLVDDKN